MLKYLKPALDFEPDRIILGCTHYPYLLESLSKYAKKELFVDPAISFAACVLNDYPKIQQKGTKTFFTSSSPEEFVKNASVFYNIEEKVEPV